MRIGTIAYATDQGLGHLAKQFYDAGVITDVCIFHHSSRVNHAEWYPEGTMVIARRPFDWPEIQAWLRQLDAILFFETPFDWTVIPRCRNMGVRTYIMPMYECTPERIPHQPDRWLCPSLLDVEYFKQFSHEFIEVPVPQGIVWQQRSCAKRFLHNGGHLGLRGHKGTLEILQAMRYVKSSITLTVRSQDEAGLDRLLSQVQAASRDQRIHFTYGTIPYEDLFTGHDVFIMAEKYNGLSLPLREARASGMIVMTSDRFPMNTWLPQWPLIPVSHFNKERVGGPYMYYDEAVLDPQVIARQIDLVADSGWGRIEEYSREGAIWAREMSWENLKPKWLEVLSR